MTLASLLLMQKKLPQRVARFDFIDDFHLAIIPFLKAERAWYY
jgi:hypothetical protein